MLQKLFTDIHLPISPRHFAPCLVLAPVIFLIRFFTEKLFQRFLLSKRRYSVKTVQKASESFYYFFQYLFLFLFSRHLIRVNDSQPYHYQSFYMDYPQRQAYKWQYAAFFDTELSVYFASSAFLFLETRKSNSDFKEMIFHHIITISLILSGYGRRHYNFGLLVANLHDVTDIFLEGSKLINYLFGDPWAVFTFVEFAVAFFYTRLIVFPKYLIFPIFNGIADSEINKHVLNFQPGEKSQFSDFEKGWFIVILSMLWMIDVYWMLQVIRMVKGMAKLEIHGDIRDDEENHQTEQFQSREEAFGKLGKEE